MGSWNTFSFENDTTWDAFGSSCERDEEFGEDGRCLAIKGGTTLFMPDRETMTLNRAFDRIKPNMTTEQYHRGMKWLNDTEHVEPFQVAGFTIVGLESGARVPKKDACKTLDDLSSERSMIRDGIKKIEDAGFDADNLNEVKKMKRPESLVGGWIYPKRRLARLDEEIGYVNGKMKEIGMGTCPVISRS